MADNKNIDPLELLLSQHREAINGESSNVDPVVDTTTPTTQETSNIMDMDISADDDIYGDGDREQEIEEEEKFAQFSREEAAKEKASKIEEKKASTPFMPPDEHDMKYHDEAMAYQSEKISVVSNMVNRVVAKYRIISGGIEELPDPKLGTIGKMAVMGELVDIYHNSGEKITPEFEDMILKNWIMPDGTLAIHNINDQGIVIDRTMMNAPTNTTPTNRSTNNEEEAPEEEKKPETPVINIQVEKNTPVTVNVDESIVAQTAKTNEVNIYVREVSEKELLKTTIVENSEQQGIINVYDSGINDVPITLPLSGYRCVMRSINWFDFIKLTAPTSQNGSDNELKKWSVIYEHLKSPSIGEFKDFEDFMKKTKYQDRELLMWGLLVATADDEENLSITCGNPNCRKPIRISYRPRTIVHLDPEKIPSWYQDAHDAGVGPDAVKIWESVSSKRTRYRLPNTGIIAEINEPSAYEFVTQKLPLIDTLYKRYRPDGNMADMDVNDASMAEFDYLSANALFISAMTIVREENGKTKEYRFTNWDQIEKIITTALDAEDSGTLLKIIEKTRNNVSPVSFRVEDINCPACGRHEEYIPITDIGNTLLFQVSRRLSNTQINLIEMD